MDEAKKTEKIAEMVAQNQSGPFLFEGMTLPPLPGLYPDTEKKFQEIHDFECRQSDLFLCTFPKAGTHWVAEILGMLIKLSAEYDILSLVDIFLEILPDKEELNKAKSPRVIITHLPYKYLPQQVRNGIGKIIYIQRNPKDLFVSLFNFQSGKQILGDQMTWGQFFDTMFRKGGWFRYTKDWEEQLSNTNILSMYYEDMKNDSTTYVLKIAKFIDISCSEDLANQISEKCSFDNMKKNKVDHTQKMNSSGRDNPSLFRKEVYEHNYLGVSNDQSHLTYVKLHPEGKDPHGVDIFSICRNLWTSQQGWTILFLQQPWSCPRKLGIVGDWKNWFTVAQNEKFDEYYKEHMKDSKLKFQYEL